MEQCLRNAFSENPEILARKPYTGHRGRLQRDFKAAINSSYPGFSSTQPVYKGPKIPMSISVDDFSGYWEELKKMSPRDYSLYH